MNTKAITEPDDDLNDVRDSTSGKDRDTNIPSHQEYMPPVKPAQEQNHEPECDGLEHTPERGVQTRNLEADLETESSEPSVPMPSVHNESIWNISFTPKIVARYEYVNVPHHEAAELATPVAPTAPTSNVFAWIILFVSHWLGLPASLIHLDKRNDQSVISTSPRGAQLSRNSHRTRRKLIRVYLLAPYVVSNEQEPILLPKRIIGKHQRVREILKVEGLQDVERACREEIKRALVRLSRKSDPLRLRS